jgi:hypothetical protein
VIVPAHNVERSRCEDIVGTEKAQKHTVGVHRAFIHRVVNSVVLPTNDGATPRRCQFDSPVGAAAIHDDMLDVDVRAFLYPNRLDAVRKIADRVEGRGDNTDEHGRPPAPEINFARPP